MSIWSKIFCRPIAYFSDFREGMILKIRPGYHTSKPYYVEIIYFNKYAKTGQVVMTTNIPGHHKLNMTIGGNWEYHRKRMEIIGMKSEFGYLLLNQKLN